MTFAPFARHCCACDFCFWASPSAFRTCAGTPACLNACVRYGASKSVYRVDDFVSGSSTQAWILPPPPPPPALVVPELFLLEPPHPATPAASVTSATPSSTPRPVLIVCSSRRWAHFARREGASKHRPARGAGASWPGDRVVIRVRGTVRPPARPLRVL